MKKLYATKAIGFEALKHRGIRAEERESTRSDSSELASVI
jgi:hypothetical protein